MTSKKNEFLEIFAALIFSNTMKFDNFQRKFPLIPPNPVEAGLKLNAHKTFVQFTFCVYVEADITKGSF